DLHFIGQLQKRLPSQGRTRAPQETPLDLSIPFGQRRDILLKRLAFRGRFETIPRQLRKLCRRRLQPVDALVQRLAYLRIDGQRHQVALTQSVGSILAARSEEHTSELQSLAYLVCRL